jgi:uncharacterized protein YecE (DUF72 family)
MAGVQAGLTIHNKPLYVGPAGWSYEDAKDIVYPDTGSRFDALGYVSRFFNTLEVNVSFYRFVTERMSESWVRRVADPEHFQFTYKLHQRFTHQRGEPYGPQDVHQFKAGIQPAAQAHMLGALLAQFPWSFRYNDESVDYLKRIAQDFGEYPIAVEVRHRSWEVPEAAGDLRNLGLSLCTVDQPPLDSNIQLLDVTTGPIAYVRLHGRNRLAESADRIFVIANNHYKGQGAANALQLRNMLTGQPVDVPPPMLRHFPVLSKIAKVTPPRQQQRELF